MSYRLVHDALHTDGCKGLTKFVLVALADYANDETGECYPSQGTIAKIVGCSRRAVLTSLKELETSGYITRSDKHGLTRKYKVTIPTCEHSSHNGTKSDCVNVVHTMPKSDCVNVVHTIDPAKPVNEVHTPVNVVHTPVNQVHTNREYNREVNRGVYTNQDKTDSKSMSVVDSVFTFSKNTSTEVAREAKMRLMKEGIAEDDAKAKIKSVWMAFAAEWRQQEAGGFAGIKAPHKYMVGVLVCMAKEGKRTAAPKEEPKTVEGIMSALKDEYKGVYPDVASHMDSIFEDISPRTIDSIRAMAARGWTGISSPLAWVRSRLDGQVYNRVHSTRLDALEAARRDHARLSRRLAECQANAAEGDSTSAAKIPGIEETIGRLSKEIKELETRLASAA